MSGPEYIRNTGQGEGTLGRGGVYCEVLVSDWLFLVDCSKAVQLLLDIIIAARKNMIDRMANLPDSFSCKIEYLCIYLHLEK